MERIFFTAGWLFIVFLFLLVITASGQDKCSQATSLCANNTIASTTQGATVSAGDPALGCGDAVLNNNVWFTVTAISNGTCTVTISRIDNNPGLAIEVFTGSCGTLTTTGA